MVEIRSTKFALTTRLAAAASRAYDPNTAPPWKVPASWAQNTAYRPGEMVIASGLWWVCQNGTGSSPVTSAASGTGPSAVDTANVVFDNQVQWLLVGEPLSLADDPQAPSITRSGSAPAAPNNVPWGPAFATLARDIVSIYGGYANPANTDRWRIMTFDRSASSLARASGGRLGFWCNAASLTFLTSAIDAGSETPWRLVVDGRYVTPSAFSNANANTYTTMTWSARRARYYEFEQSSKEGYFSTLITLYTDGLAHIWRPTAGADLRAYWISDSQGASSANFSAYSPGSGLPHRVARKLGWTDLWNASIGGTGWTAAGAGPYYTFRQRVPEGLTRDPDIWVFDGSTNDNGADASAITAAVAGSISDIRAGGSKAPVVIVGVLPVSAACVATETAIAAGVTVSGDTNTYFIPRSTAAIPPIIGAHNRPVFIHGTVNSYARDLYSGDNVHLMESVVDKHAQWIADGIRSALMFAG